MVRVDGRQLVQVFQNLIGNGIKFHKPGDPPRVHLTAERNAEHPDLWTFKVVDNGIGIQPQYAERIFMIFQRLHTRRKYAGTGIGLAICKKIVERHGGKIWVDSESGHGSSFQFLIPRAKNPLSAPLDAVIETNLQIKDSKIDKKMGK